MSRKKIALWFLIVSVAISAVLGIIAILTGNFGEFELRIIFSTLTISAASIGALACGAAGEAGRYKALSTIGIALAIFAAVLLILGIWFEPHGEQFWKFTASTSVVAAATAHACLLSLAKLARRFAWSRSLAVVTIYLLATFIILSIYFEPTSDFGLRLIGTTSIIVAAITIITPIFHRLSRDDFHNAIAETERPKLWATVTCPECGATQPNSLEETICDRCGCRFVVRILAAGKPTMKSTSTLGIKQE
jgi:ssDNA-binding Zn-finger/Zn-ribbon topoisomerase 1